VGARIYLKLRSFRLTPFSLGADLVLPHGAKPAAIDGANI
jgi:hypothetical protein